MTQDTTEALKPEAPAEMVEHVARALFDAEGLGDRLDWEKEGAEWREAYLTMARAAIGAMRSPTSDMLAIGSYSTDSCSMYGIRIIWEAMCDCALGKSAAPDHTRLIGDAESMLGKE